MRVADRQRSRSAIYREILAIAVLYARNKTEYYITFYAGFSLWRRLFRNKEQEKLLKDAYRLLEIVHDLPRHLGIEEYNDWDVFFVNNRAKYFLYPGDPENPAADQIRDLVQELVNSLPTELKKQITNPMFL